MKQTVNVRIMENDFQLACEADEKTNIEESARYLNEQLRAFRRDNPQVPYEKLLLMGALRVTCELFAQNQEMRDDINSTNATLERLLQQITPEQVE